MEKQETFSRLIDGHLNMLRRVVWPILRNASDVDDVIQDTLLKAWQKFDLFKQNSAFSSWVYRIAVNAAYDLRRKQLRERQIVENADIASPYASENEHDRLLTALDEALLDLPDLYRQALLLMQIEGLSGERAAEIAGCSPNTLYQRVSEAKKRLKNALREVKNEER